MRNLLCVSQLFLTSFHMFNIFFFKIVIVVVSLGTCSGAVVGPTLDLKQFSGNPKDYSPCAMVKNNAGSDCRSKICHVWHELYRLDPFVKKQWRMIFARSKRRLNARSPAFLFYFAMWRYHEKSASEDTCEKDFVSIKDGETTFETLMIALAEWWTKFRDLRVETNQILDSESLKLYNFIRDTKGTKGLYRVKLTGGKALRIDTTFSTDCGKFLLEIFQGYGKFTSEYECQSKKWEVLQAVAGKLNWVDTQEDPQALCSPEMKAALEYELKRKGDCPWSLKNLSEVVAGNTGCVSPKGVSKAPETLEERYEACVAKLDQQKDYLRRNFIILREQPVCSRESGCDEAQVKQFESAMFVARVWGEYASAHLLATSLRMFYISSLVPFLDLAKYPVMRFLSKHLPPYVVRKISIALRLVRKSVVHFLLFLFVIQDPIHYWVYRDLQSRRQGQTASARQ